MTTIKLKYLRNIRGIEKINTGDWIDLRAGETIKLKKGEFRMIPLGVAIQLPKGYEAIVAPRSSTFKNLGIIMANSIGVIDESYCGDGDEWHFPALAMRKTIIHKDDRICQFRIIRHQPDIEFIPVITLDNKDRGGLGSTGRV